MRTSSAERLGLGTSTLKMVLSGKRNLSAANLHRVARSLKLNSDELEYFLALSARDRCPDPAGEKFFAKRVKSFRDDAKVRSVLISDKHLLADIYTIPILVFLTDLKKIDKLELPLPPALVQQVATFFAIKPSRVLSSLQVLKDQSIVPNGEGFEIHYVFDRLSHFINQKSYLKSWANEAVRQMEANYDNPQTFFNASTISIRESEMKNLKSEMKQLLEKYISLPVKANDRTAIVQVCSHMFILGRP